MAPEERSDPAFEARDGSRNSPLVQTLSLAQCQAKRDEGAQKGYPESVPSVRTCYFGCERRVRETA